MDKKQAAIENIRDPAPCQEEKLDPRGCFLDDFAALRPRLPLVPVLCNGHGYFFGISPRRGPCLLRVASETARRTPAEARLDVAIAHKTGATVVLVRSLEDLILLGFDCNYRGDNNK